MKRIPRLTIYATLSESKRLKCRFGAKLATVVLRDFNRLVKLAKEAEHTNKATAV
jgi:hypothetical protein